MKLERRLAIPALVVVVAAVASNVLFLHESYESYLRTSRLERADLAAVEIARDTVEPGLVLSEDIADTGYVPVEAGSYLSARDAFGSPAYPKPNWKRRRRKRGSRPTRCSRRRSGSNSSGARAGAAIGKAAEPCEPTRQQPRR